MITFSLLSGFKTKVFSFVLANWLVVAPLVMTAPQLNEVTELKQLNNVSGVSTVVTTTEDATSTTAETQPSKVNSTVLEDDSSAVTNFETNSNEEKASTEAETSTSKKVEKEPKPESNTTVQNVPKGHSFKSYTNYKLLNPKSRQGQLQKLAYSDENGLRKVGEYYCVALGTYYGTEIGACYIVTLSTGVQFKMTLCDMKANRHTDANNQYTVSNGCMAEFYVDYTTFNSKARRAGDISVIDGFAGSVVSIKRLNNVNVFDLYG